MPSAIVEAFVPRWGRARVGSGGSPIMTIESPIQARLALRVAGSDHSCNNGRRPASELTRIAERTGAMIR